MPACQGLLVVFLGAPVDEVAGIEGDAEEISGDEAELSGADADDADDGTVDSGHDPALPEFPANENGGEHGKNAGQIVKPNHVYDVGQHVGSVRQEEGLLQQVSGEDTLQPSSFKSWRLLNKATKLGAGAWIQRFPGYFGECPHA